MIEIEIENLECRYFITYSGVKLPLKLVTPLTESELQNRNTFFRGYFDSADKLLLCEKLVYGDSELEHRYRYFENGVLQEAEITDADGEITVMTFDETGKLLDN
jgi:hypothetical protein